MTIVTFMGRSIEEMLGSAEGKARDTDIRQPGLAEGIPRSLELCPLWTCQGLPVPFRQNWHEI